MNYRTPFSLLLPRLELALLQHLAPRTFSDQKSMKLLKKLFFRSAPFQKAVPLPMMDRKVAFSKFLANLVIII